MIHWGWRLLLTGVVMALASAAPALLVWVLPAIGEGFIGTLAILLTLTVTPLSLLFLSAGVILLLAGLWQRRARGGPARAPASSPPGPPAR